MAFQTKDFASIAASMINYAKAVQKKITDFSIGSIARTMWESVAIEIDELYQQMFNGLKEGIPVATYNSFNFTKLAAVPASGLIRVTISAQATDTIISAGTAFKIAGESISYVSSFDTTIDDGDTFADVLAVASTPGLSGNIPASTAFTVTPSPIGFVSAANASSFTNGRDVETDADRKIRFAAFISALPRGTVAAILYGLKNEAFLVNSVGVVIEHVATASVVEPWLADNTQPISLVNCYIHNGIGSTSVDLVTKATAVVYGYYDDNGKPVPGWKAAGVKVVVYAATETLVPITAVLTALPGYVAADLRAAAQAALTAYVNGLDIGVSAIRSEMIATVMEIEGVYNFVMSAPSGDTTATNTHKLLTGTVAIT